jgi:hypothetical protein
MTRKHRRPRSELPPEPTGYELLDLIWAHLTPYAAGLLTAAPVERKWATKQGMAKFVVTLVLAETARTAAKEGRTDKTIARVRQREAERLERQLHSEALAIIAALGAEQRQQWSQASPGQLWLLVRDRIRVLIKAVLADIERKLLKRQAPAQLDEPGDDWTT